VDTRIEDSPVFICGLPRTGTTLLLALLDGHPELVVNWGESGFFREFLRQGAHLSGQERLEKAVEILLEPWEPSNVYYESFLSHVSCQRVFELFLRRMSETDGEEADYLTAAVLAYGEASGQLDDQPHRWVEKTPGNEHYARLVFRWWDDPKCIHMIRDPRAVYASFKRRALRKSKPVASVGAISYVWLRSILALERNLRSYGRERVLPLRYEDLVSDPEHEMGRVADHLGVATHEALLIPTKGAGAVFWKGNAVRRQYREVSSAALGRWRQELSEGEIALLETLLGTEMTSRGYECQSMGGPAIRLRARLVRLVNVGRQLRTSLRQVRYRESRR
jgi:hypothetical protein